jgi:Lysyl oxidase
MIPGDARASSPPSSKQLLPDLAQHPPAQISVQQVAGANGIEFRLGFRSAVANIGEGPLIIHGSRPNTSTPMRASQLVKLADGGRRRYENVIPMEYAYSETHDHFHVLRFDRYSLRDASTGARVRPDKKSGFCLGDREEVNRPLNHPPPHYGPPTGECQRGKPQALRVVEGLTPGYLDDYAPQLEGQYIEVTGVPAGRYSLVHRVNARRRIRERDVANDVASALIEIGWPNGPRQPPTVSVLDRCRERALCAPEGPARPVPVLTPAETSRFRLWCSLLEPAGPLTGSGARVRRARIAASRSAWRAAVARADGRPRPR